MFVGRDVALPDQSADTDGELRHLDLLYREKVEFAVGHGIAVHAELSGGDPYRATSVRTSVIPRSEVAKVEAPGPDDPALDATERELMGTVTFDMEALSLLDGPGAATVLRPLAVAYDRWLDRQADRLGDLSDDQADAARTAIESAHSIAERLRIGIDLLASDPIAAEAFAVREPHDVATATPHARRVRSPRRPQTHIVRRRDAGRLDAELVVAAVPDRLRAGEPAFAWRIPRMPNASSTPAPPTFCSSRPAAARPRPTLG